MNNIANYIKDFFTLGNPLLFGLLVTAVVTIVIVFFFLKIYLPLQKKRILEKQKHLLRTAELMALFSEMDPSPQIRIDKNGQITNTNIAARSILKGIDSPGRNINEFIPMLTPDDYKTSKQFVDVIGDNIYSINIKPGRNFDFINVYLYDITQQKNYETSLEEYKNKLKDLAGKLDTGLEEIKKTVSRELHDDIGQRLLALKMRTASADINDAELSADLENIYQRVRELSHELRPVDIGKLGLVSGIQNLVENVEKNAGIKGYFQYNSDDTIIEDNIATCLFRIAQEALSNIVKHSKAGEFTVGLQFKEETVDLVVIDNGVGISEGYFNAQNYRNYGIGLFNMKERVEKHNGIFKINSNSGTGTVLIIQLPLTEK